MEIDDRRAVQPICGCCGLAIPHGVCDDHIICPGCLREIEAMELGWSLSATGGEYE